MVEAYFSADFQPKSNVLIDVLNRNSNKKQKKLFDYGYCPFHLKKKTFPTAFMINLKQKTSLV